MHILENYSIYLDYNPLKAIIPGSVPLCKPYETVSVKSLISR